MTEADQRKSKSEAAQAQPSSENGMKGDYARGMRTVPASNDGPDFARGERTLPPLSEGGSDYARGERTLPPRLEGPDYARGLRGNLD